MLGSTVLILFALLALAYLGGQIDLSFLEKDAGLGKNKKYGGFSIFSFKLRDSRKQSDGGDKTRVLDNTEDATSQKKLVASSFH